MMGEAKVTQMCESTNRIQRLVMARQILAMRYGSVKYAPPSDYGSSHCTNAGWRTPSSDVSLTKAALC